MEPRVSTTLLGSQEEGVSEDSKPRSAAPEGFRELQWFGYAGIFVVFEIVKFFKITRFEDFERFDPATAGPSDFHLFYVRLILFCCLLGLSALWILATDDELKIWLGCLVNIKEDGLGTVMILATALYLGIALALVGSATLIACFFSFALLLNAVTQWYTDLYFKRHVDPVSLPQHAYRQYWDYQQPVWRSKQVLRLVCMSLLSFTAWHYSRNGRTLLAYWILISDLAAGETVIWMWRVRRNRSAETERSSPPQANPLKEPTPASFLPWSLASVPLLSFLGQILFSWHDHKLSLMMRHPTVMLVDWILVPFNFGAARAIDWRRGLAIFNIAALSTCLVITTHAVWQAQGLDPGHMITKDGVILPAGWVHVWFSILETVIFTAFVFCRRVPNIMALASATAYLAGMFAAGYWIHQRIILSDACVFGLGLFFLYLYPRFGSPNKGASASINV
jgi:hypothetical protein